MRRFFTPLPTLLLLGAVLSSVAHATDTLRVATLNMQQLNFGTTGFSSLVSTLSRVNADVVMIEEVDGPVEAAQMSTLASAAGYPFHQVSGISGTLSGDLRNAVLSRHPIASSQSWSATAISGDPQANDITRDIFQVILSIPDVCEPVSLFALHLKAGSTSTDDFRRAVELIRVKKVVEGYLSQQPGATIFIGGDMNDDAGDAPFGATFNSLPGGLPASYRLGNDISFPLVYNPFLTVAGIGGQTLQASDARQEDSNSDFTRIPSQRRLDYIFRSVSTIELGKEVYYSLQDNGVDDGASGGFLYKNGPALPSSVSAATSDHLPVFADFLLEGCDGTRYGSGFPGSHLLTPRAGLRGIAKAGSASFGFRLHYGAPNQVGILILGSQRLNPPFGFSLTPTLPGATLHVAIATAYGFFNVVTDAKGELDFPLPLPNSPTVVGLSFNPQWFVSDAAGPNGIGSISDAIEVIIAP